MKRNSLLLAAWTAAAAVTLGQSTWAIDVLPNNSSSSPNPYAPFPSQTPFTVDPYGMGSMTPTSGAAQDPFFNPQNYFLPVPTFNQPGTGTTSTFNPAFNPNPTFNPNPSINPNPLFPGTQNPTVPNPNPGTFPNPTDGRERGIGQTAPINNQPTTRRWRLGVYSRDTDTGVAIAQVLPNSAAARARLEAKDVIVAVNGYQVGWVTGALYDCSTEFERRADNDGWVSLLVQNHRDGRLVNVPLQLESRFQRINGTLSLDGRQVPRGAIVQVELKEIVRPEAPPVTIKAERLTDLSKFPIPFQIEYDPLQIDSRRNYIVTASVTHNGQLLYETRQNYAVLTPGQSRQVAIAVERVVSSPLVTNTSGAFPRSVQDRNQQMAQIRLWFRDYLRREPTQNELNVWMQALDQGYTLPDVQVELLSHNQLFNQLNQDKRAYIEQMHRFLIGRDPTPEELQYWMARYDQTGGLRRDFAREFQEAVSAR